MDLDKQINDFLGVNKPKEIKKEMSMQERLNAISDVGPLSLGKTSDYFEEAYKGLEPDLQLDKQVEEMFTESVIEPKLDLSSLSVEELEALAEEKTFEIEKEQIAEIGKQTLSFEYQHNPEAQVLESVDSYKSALSRTVIEEDEELIDPDKFRLNEMDRKIIAISNSLEGMKGYITEGTLVSGIGQGGDGQLPGGGEVLLRGLDDVNLAGLQDGDSLVWNEIEGQFLPGAGGGGGATGGPFLPLDGSEPMTGTLNIIYDPRSPINRLQPAFTIRDAVTSPVEYMIDYQGVFIRDFTDPTFEYVPPTRNYLTNKAYVDDELMKAQIGGLFNFKGDIDATVDAPIQPINSGDVYLHSGPNGTTVTEWGSLQIETGDYLVFEGRVWQIQQLDGDVFVKKTGDTMTGSLKLETPAGQPQTMSNDSDAVNVKHVAENYLDVSGGTLSGTIFHCRRKASAAEFAAESSNDNSNLRFVTFKTRIPQDTDKTGSGNNNEDNSSLNRYGIRFKLDDGNSFRNTLGVDNRTNRFITISGGVDPALHFNSSINDSNFDPNDTSLMDRAGVKITGIPTPGPSASGTTAVNKMYCDNNFINVTGGQLTGQLEVMSPGAFISHNIDYQNTNNPLDGATLFDVIDVADDTEKFKMSAFRYDRNSTGKDVHTVNQQIYYSPAKNEDGEYWFRIRDTDTNTSQSLLILRSDKADFQTNIDMHYNHVEYLSDPTDSHQAATKNYVDNLTKFVKKSGDTMTGDLTIDVRSGASTGLEAKLDLYGARTGNASPAGSIHFDNNNSTEIGVFGFHSSNTNLKDDAFFKFSHNVQLDSNLLQQVGGIVMKPDAYIQCDGLDLIRLKRSTSGVEDNAAVQIERAHTNARRTFAIRGNDSSNNLIDVFFAYANASGGDSVEYKGRITNDNDLVNKKYVDDNAGGGKPAQYVGRAFQHIATGSETDGHFSFSGNWNGNGPGDLVFAKIDDHGGQAYPPDDYAFPTKQYMTFYRADSTHKVARIFEFERIMLSGGKFLIKDAQPVHKGNDYNLGGDYDVVCGPLW